MRLVITTPSSIVVDVSDVAHIRAEDRTGAFGIAPGHADFVTLVPISVVTWTNTVGTESFALVRSGVLSVREGKLVELAVRGAYREDQLSELDEKAIAALREADESEDTVRTTDTRLHLATMRQIERVLHAGRGDGGSAPPLLDRRTGGGEA